MVVSVGKYQSTFLHMPSSSKPLGLLITMKVSIQGPLKCVSMAAHHTYTIT